MALETKTRENMKVKVDEKASKNLKKVIKHGAKMLKKASKKWVTLTPSPDKKETSAIPGQTHTHARSRARRLLVAAEVNREVHCSECGAVGVNKRSLKSGHHQAMLHKF